MSTDGMLKISKQLENEISQTTDFETMRAKLHEAAAQQPNVRMARDWNSPVERVQTASFSRDSGDVQDRLRNERGQFVSQQTAPRTFSRTETIGGRQLTFEASSELELETRIREAYEVVEALGTQPREEPFVPELPAHERAELSEFQKVDLQLKFQRGELTAQQYLEQSGAIAEYLEAQGTPLELLRETVQTDAQNRFTQSWAEAAEAFRNIHSDWPGGQQNLEVLGLKIQALGLIDAENKLAALEQAYSEMKQSQMIFAGPAASEVEQVTAALRDASPSEIMEAYHAASGHSLDTNSDAANDSFVRSLSNSGSGLFGR